MARSCSSRCAAGAGARSSRTACASWLATARWRPGMRLPSSRALADDLDVSRRLVVDAYAQLLAEGYGVTSRRGAGTYRRRDRPRRVDGVAARAPERALQFDFFPGVPDLASFPQGPCGSGALREVLRTAPGGRVRRPRRSRCDRAALAPSARIRSVGADARRRAGGDRRLRRRDPGPRAARGARWRGGGVSAIAVENPGRRPTARRAVPTPASSVEGAPVDEQGVDVGRGRRAGRALSTPAHQCPTGARARLPARRGEILPAWARAGGLVIEDDYDAEFRYDRAPLGALQGLAPLYRVALPGNRCPQDARAGTATRRGLWCCSPSLIGAVARGRRRLERPGCCDAGQARARPAAAEMAAYDRHLRKAGAQAQPRAPRRADRCGRARRHSAGARRRASRPACTRSCACLGSVDADRGLHVAVRASASVRVCHPSQRPHDRAVRRASDALVLGYANLAEPAIAEGVRRLAQALREAGVG